MIKTVLEIDGMMCNMCESHVNDGIRNKFKVEKVSSSHRTGETEIISKEPLDKEEVKRVVEENGYKVLSINEEPYEKKSFWKWGK